MAEPTSSPTTPRNPRRETFPPAELSEAGEAGAFTEAAEAAETAGETTVAETGLSVVTAAGETIWTEAAVDRERLFFRSGPFASVPAAGFGAECRHV